MKHYLLGFKSKESGRNLLRIVASVLFTVVLITNSSLAFAVGSYIKEPIKDIKLAQYRAELVLKDLDKDITITDYILLKNLDDEYEAVSFNLKGKGYIIVNIDDLSVPEMNFEAESPYQDCKEPVYNGPLSYYYKDGESYISLKEKQIYKKEQFKLVYNQLQIDNKEEFLEIIEKKMQETRSNANVTKYISGSLQRWTIGGNNCGSIACAICMRYYHDYVHSYYITGNTGRDAVIALMQQYVGVGFTDTPDLVNGMNQYFAERHISNLAQSTSYFSFSLVKSKINSDRPVIIDTDNHPEYTEHWLIAHGYFYSAVNGDYVIVNDGWGNNYTWVSTSGGYLDDLVYFYN